MGMETNWAAEQLQTIRTLMERAALYRRALAPIMLLAGGIGVLAGVVALLLRVENLHTFCALWFGVAAVAVAGAFLLARLQSLKDREPLWSPPTRRVAQAMAPPLTIGFLSGVLAFTTAANDDTADVILPLVWMLCYGCALHAAGFFVPRGIRLLGWFFILGACGVFGVWLCSGRPRDAVTANIVMGVFFGAVHLAYGACLAWTENRKAAA